MKNINNNTANRRINQINDKTIFIGFKASTMDMDGKKLNSDIFLIK